MMAPPGSPKMVDVPSSTSDRQIARAPVMRIRRPFPLQQKTPPPYRGEVVIDPAVPPCFQLREAELDLVGGSIVRHPGSNYYWEGSFERLGGEFGTLPGADF